MELLEFAKSNISASILNSEQSGLLTGTCLVEGRACASVGAAVSGYSWTSVGKGLLEILKIGGLVSSATCLSLSVANIVTCGGLRLDTCQKYKDVKASMDGLKDLASVAIDENAELRSWNASNLDIIYKLGSIQQEIETIVENNALLMDALGVLHYNSTPTDMRPDEAGDEYDKDLQKKKLEIEADIEQYLKSLDDKISVSRDRIGKANIKCSKSSLEKLADWTKDMDEVQFDDFLQKVKSSKEGTDNFISKATNKPDVEIKPPAKGGIMSKLTAKFKPVGQFFSKVKSAIKSVTAGFRKTKVWQGLKKYGFDAFGAIMAAASIGMCIHQVVT